MSRYLDSSGKPLSKTTTTEELQSKPYRDAGDESVREENQSSRNAYKVDR